MFLDRDGVINHDLGYVGSIDSFVFVDGIFDLVTTANQLGYLVVVITNQSGIGRGYYTLEEYENLTEWMLGQFSDAGCVIDAVYFCPEVPAESTEDSERVSCRKPSPFMFLKARDEMGIDMCESIVVGDKSTDIEAAFAAGVGHRFILRETHHRAMSITRLNEVTEFLEHL